MIFKPYVYKDTRSKISKFRLGEIETRGMNINYSMRNSNGTFSCFLGFFKSNGGKNRNEGD